MNTKVFWVILFIVVAAYLNSTVHVQYSRTEVPAKAWFIQLPGWEEVYSPEQVVELADWVGSGMKDLTVTVDGGRSPEIEAAAALKSLGVYGEEYEVTRRDGHWVLCRPAITGRYFTLQANYRIGSWRLVAQ